MHKKDKAHAERSLEVYKHNDMVQKTRYSLSIQEQRAVLYAISKIKPEDTLVSEYTFDIKDFYNVIGWRKESYTEFKAMLKKLRDKSWWITLEDGETESAVSWFSTVRSNQKSGKVTIKFHEDMMPFLIQLAQGEGFYTKYRLQYVLPMSSQYSPRLYELLKSYQYNNRQWFFDIDDLKHKLDCKSYANFNDFKRRVLDPAVEEINKYTDIAIFYSTEKEGRKVVKVHFFMDRKTKTEILEVQKAINEELDQLTIDDVIQAYYEPKPEDEFLKERKRVKAEEKRKEKEQEERWKKKFGSEE